MSNKIKILSLFSGCGGMDLGFEGDFFVHKDSVNFEIHPEWRTFNKKDDFVKLPKTFFDVVFANDILSSAKAAWEPFFKKENTFFKESIIDLVKKSSAGEFIFPETDIVIGGFPCQDFSVAGKRKGFNSHKSHLGKVRATDEPTIESRGQLYMWMRKVIEITKPKMFIAENVKGLVSLSDVKNIIEKDFRTIDNGYHVFDAKVLHSAKFGIPQSRERVIFIGINKDYVNFNLVNCIDTLNLYPTVTHSDEDTLFERNLKPYVTLQSIFSDLPEPEESIDPAQQAYSKAKWYGKHCQGNKEINLNSIGPTIRAEHHGNIEFRRLSKEHGGRYSQELSKGLKERRLTVRECARIQTFPDEFIFIRKPEELGKEYTLSASSAYKIIGNAVPPLLAFHLAWRIQEVWADLFGENYDCIRKQEAAAVSV